MNGSCSNKHGSLYTSQQACGADCQTCLAANQGLSCNCSKVESNSYVIETWTRVTASCVDWKTDILSGACGNKPAKDCQIAYYVSQ